MEKYSLNDVKKELGHLDKNELIELCLKLTKFKRENKEYITYLIYNADNKMAFAFEIKSEIDALLLEIKSKDSPYLIKKGLRKTLRLINKYIKIIGDKSVAIELLIYFCANVKKHELLKSRNSVLYNLYNMQTKKINTLIHTLHEDLQSDFLKELEVIF
jgi:hypothetical protein